MDPTKTETTGAAEASSPVVDPAPTTPTSTPESSDVVTSETATTSTPNAAESSPGATTPAPAEGLTEESAAPAETATSNEPSALPEWNGELDSLKDADWFKSIDEPRRNLVLAGLQQKYRHLEAGFTRKTQEMADFRKAATAKEEKLTKELAYYQRFLDTGESPSDQLRLEAAAARKELEQVRQERELLETRLREDLTREFEQTQLTPLQEQLRALQEERDQLNNTLTQQQQQAAEEQRVRNEQVLDALISYVDEKAPALWEDENTAALTMFENLLRHEIAVDPDEALRLVGARFPAFDASAAAPVPDSVEVMNNESTVAFGQLGTADNVGYEEAKRRVYKSLGA
jgi:hypothetical protein